MSNIPLLAVGDNARLRGCWRTGSSAGRAGGFGRRRRTRGDRGQGRRGLASADVQNVLHVGSVGLLVHDVTVGEGRFPQHDASERRGVLGHVIADKHLRSQRIDVVVVTVTGSGNQTDEQLGIGTLTLAKRSNPGIVVEAEDVVGRAAGIVVELHPDEIEHRVLDCVAQLRIRVRTLRRS